MLATAQLISDRNNYSLANLYILVGVLVGVLALLTAVYKFMSWFNTRSRVWDEIIGIPPGRGVPEKAPLAVRLSNLESSVHERLDFIQESQDTILAFVTQLAPDHGNSVLDLVRTLPAMLSESRALERKVDCIAKKLDQMEEIKQTVAPISQIVEKLDKLPEANG